MVRWLVLAALVTICFVRYVWVLNSQIYPNIGDTVRVVGTVWNRTIRVQNKIFAVSDHSLELSDGDTVRLTGNITGQVISKYGKQYTLDMAHIEGIKTPFFVRLRDNLQRRIRYFLPGDMGGLASGLLLGGGELLSHKTKLKFTVTGLSHVVAASGYNVVLVSGWLGYLGKKLKWRKLTILFDVLGISLYMLVAGLTPSIIRAGIMMFMTITASIYGRKGDPIWSLIIVAVIMIFWNPWLLSDIGFQLSVMATLGVLISTSHKWAIISEIKLIFMVQIFTIPLILHHFGQLSVIAPVANFAVVWIVPYIMQLTVLGLIFPPALYLAWPLLSFMLDIVFWLANIPWASVSVGQMSWVWVAVYYLILGIVYNRYYAKRQITPDYR